MSNFLTGLLKAFVTPGRSIGAIPLIAFSGAMLLWQGARIFYIKEWPMAGDIVHLEEAAWFAATLAVVAMCWREIRGIKKRGILIDEEMAAAVSAIPTDRELPPLQPPPRPAPEELPDDAVVSPVADDDEPETPSVLPPIPPVSTSRNFNDLKDEYDACWANCEVRPERVYEVDRAVTRILNNRASYEHVSDNLNTAMPWWYVAVIHQMECAGRFDWHLHNGDPLKNGRTRRVPAGRPAAPPLDPSVGYTWEESAIDALSIGAHDVRGEKDWSVARVLHRLERYNGFGYRNKGIRTAYLWGFTNLEMRGRYVADGVFDPNAVTGQPGCAALMRSLGVA